MGSIFSSEPDPIAPPDYSKVDPLTDKLYEQINNNQPWNAGKDTAGQAQFKYMANQAQQNVQNGIAQQRGVRASQLATMANNTQANMQSQAAAQAGVRDAMEREAAQNQLANIFMQQQGQIAAVNQANQAQQQANINAQDRMIGLGLTGAAMAFGGPAAGMATGAMTSGMGSTPTGGGVNFSGPNPYAGPAPTSAYQQYSPSQYNMGQGLQLNGGY